MPLASVTASDRPKPVGCLPKAAVRASTARRDATSPPAWPPIPSATAKRLEVSMARSWLTERTRPVSVAEPERRRVISPPDLEHGAAYLQEVALVETDPLVDALGVHPGPVGRPEVLGPQIAVEPEEPGVQVGGVGVVVDGHAAACGPAHGDLVTDVVGATGLVFGADHMETELLGLPLLAIDNRIGVAAAAAAALEGADLHPHGADHPHEEQPQQDDHAVLERSEYRGVVRWSGERNQDQVHSRSDAGFHEVSNRSTVVPITIWSPSTSFRSRIGAPLTRVPLVALRSTTTTSLPTRRISAWRRLALGSVIITELSGRRPRVRGSGPSTTRLPSAVTTEAAGRPAGPSWTSETISKRPRRWRGSSMTETVTGPTNT